LGGIDSSLAEEGEERRRGERGKAETQGRIKERMSGLRVQKEKRREGEAVAQ